MIYSVIAFLLALIPFVVWKELGYGIRTPKEVASVLGLLIICGVSIRFYNRHRFKNVWLLLFWGWCLFTVINNQFTIPIYLDRVVLELPAMIIAWKEMFYISLTCFSIICISTIDTCDCKSMGNRFFKIFMPELTFKDVMYGISKGVGIVMIIMCGYSIIQTLGLDNFFRVVTQDGFIATENLDLKMFQPTHRVVGTVGNPTILASWIAICLPLCFYVKGKIKFISVILAVITLLIVNSTTAYVAVTISLMFYLFCKNKRTFILMLILVSLLCVKYHDKIDCEPTGRIAVHQEMWKQLNDRPLLGWGLGTFEYLIGLNPEVIDKLKDENWRELHDEYGQIWFAVGLIGLTLFLMFIFTTFVRFFKNMTNETIPLAACMVSFLVSCLTLFPMRIAPASFYGVIFCGLLLKGIREET